MERQLDAITYLREKEKQDVGKKFRKHLFCALLEQGTRDRSLYFRSKESLVIELCKRMSRYMGAKAFSKDNMFRVRYVVWFLEAN